MGFVSFVVAWSTMPMIVLLKGKGYDHTVLELPKEWA